MKFPKIVINRSVVLLLAALTLGGLSAFGVKRFIERQVAEVEARGKGKMVRVIVPKEDLQKGTALTEAAVASREVPADWAHSNAITPQQFDRVAAHRPAGACQQCRRLQRHRLVRALRPLLDVGHLQAGG